jgi:hypothetical protein
MINFTRAFELAWERMVVILFRPFDLGKWFTIGFSAFLAGLLAGGNGFSGSYGNNTFNKNNTSFNYDTNMHSFNSAFSGLQTGIMILLVLVIFLVVLALILLVYWLGARGQFLFLDNLVRNRGAIAWPWQAYARQGNSLFLFYLLYFVICLAVFLPLTLLGFWAAWPLLQQHRWPQGGEIPVFVLLGLVFLFISVALTVVLFLFREWGVPLMFRNGLPARTAFRETWTLVGRNPGNAFLFVVLRIALFVALIVVSIIVCCGTCCLGALPYLGTVFLLPALVYIKCFSLDCLAQMDPSCDVWTTDVPLAPASVPPPTVTPPPPPG